MEVEEELFKERPPLPGEFVLGQFIRVVTDGRGAGRVLGGGLAEEAGILENRLQSLLGDPSGLLPREAIIAFELFECGNIAIGVDNAATAAQAQGLVSSRRSRLRVVKSGGGAVCGRQPIRMIAKANGMTIAMSHLFMRNHAAKSHFFVKLPNEIQNTKAHASARGSIPRRSPPQSSPSAHAGAENRLAGTHTSCAFYPAGSSACGI